MLPRPHSGLIKYPWVFFIILMMPVAHAENDRSWGFSPMVIISKPKLKLFNEKELKAPIVLTANSIDELGNSIKTPFTFENPLDDFKTEISGGAEFQWRLHRNHSLILGYSSWEATSSGTIQADFPLQEILSNTIQYRKTKLSYNEFFVGWRYRLFQRNRYNFYFQTGLHELFDIDFREDLSFEFVDLPSFSVAGGLVNTPERNIIVQAQSTGTMMIQFGAGGEYFLSDWLSVGFEAGYSFGLEDTTLKNQQRRWDFLAMDNISTAAMNLPTKKVGNETNYLSDFYYDEDEEKYIAVYEKLTLDFDSWKVMLKFTIYY